MDEETEKLPIVTHLDELRKTLLWSLVGLLAGVIVAVFFVNPVLAFLTRPIGGMQNLYAIEVTETMSVYMRVALLGGLIIALPWITYQLLSFVGKGLKINERKGIFIALPFAVLLFIAGVAFAYFVMLPTSLAFFQEILDVTTSIRLKSYIGFATNLYFGSGLVFSCR